MPAMIVAPEPTAAEEGAKVLARGGNAVDAAVVCALTQGIVNPHNAGVGGYSLLTMFRAGAVGGPFVSLDAPALAGSLTSAGMWEDRVIGPNPDGWGYFLRGKVNAMGYTSVCAPGSVRAWSAMLERWGTLSWAEAIEPAACIAEEGFMVRERLAAGWREHARHPEDCAPIDQITSHAEARRIYLRPDGEPYGAGQVLRNPDYARTLRRLAASGADDLYCGALAREIGDDLAAHGSFVTARDLAEYRMRDAAPVVGHYRGYTVATSSAPHGGPTLMAILNILETMDLRSMAHNGPEYIYCVSMAMKAAFADRNPFLGDPEFVDVPQEWMVSKERAAEWRAHIAAGKRIRVSFVPGESPDTTHVTVVDHQGNAVALTHSLGMGSGVITPGLGFMYNNSMVNYHPFAGHPNSIAPRKSRTTGMSPTIIAKDGRPILAIGAPGATRIITSVAQVIVNVLDFGMSVVEAVSAPRFHCQGDVIRCQGRIPEYVCAQVRAQHPIEVMPQSHGGLALVEAIAIDSATGHLSGAADTGSDGMALPVP